MVERYLALGGFPAHAATDGYQLVRERLRSDIVDRALRRDLAGRADDPEKVPAVLQPARSDAAPPGEARRRTASRARSSST